MLAENCRALYDVWSVLSYSRQVVVQHSSTVDDLIQLRQKKRRKDALIKWKFCVTKTIR